MATQINYIEFPCRNLPAIKKFYREAFGWAFTDYGPTYAAFEDGFIAGGFDQDSDMPIGGGALVVLFSNELEACLDQVKVSGGTIVQEIYSFPGGRRFHFIDPDGNVLAVWSH